MKLLTSNCITGTFIFGTFLEFDFISHMRTTHTNAVNVISRPRIQISFQHGVSNHLLLAVNHYSLNMSRLAPMWQQPGTLLFCSCHGIAGFLVDELQILIWRHILEVLPEITLTFFKKKRVNHLC